MSVDAGEVMKEGNEALDKFARTPLLLPMIMGWLAFAAALLFLYIVWVTLRTELKEERAVNKVREDRVLDMAVELKQLYRENKQVRDSLNISQQSANFYMEQYLKSLRK